MAATKSANPDKAQEVKIDEGLGRPESDIMADIGITVELRKLGTVEVNELSLESVLRLSDDLVGLLTTMSDMESPKPKEGQDENVAWFLHAMRQPALLNALKAVAAGSTGKKTSDFDELSITDWLKWAAAFKTVTNWEDLKTAFFQLLPPDQIANVKNLISSLKESGAE